jgi:hypothetical protein
MNLFCGRSLEGKWRMHTGGGTSPGSLSIEKTGETYKCVWRSDKEYPEYYFGLGIAAGHKLYVSRFKQRDTHSNVMPPGGVAVYKPIGDRRSLAALWAETDNFCALGSGIAIRKESGESFAGNYEIRYFEHGLEVARFNLTIAKRSNEKCYRLNWDREEKQIFHGIGMVVDRQMVVAWGELATDWEAAVLNVKNQGKGCLLKSRRVSQKNNVICEETFARNN